MKSLISDWQAYIKTIVTTLTHIPSVTTLSPTLRAFATNAAPIVLMRQKQMNTSSLATSYQVIVKEITDISGRWLYLWSWFMWHMIRDSWYPVKWTSYTKMSLMSLLHEMSMQTHTYILIRSHKKAAMYVSFHQAGFTNTLLAKHDHFSIHSHGSHDYLGL